MTSPFSSILTLWYQSNKRDLPWRDTVDPYAIWISEIILQQTRVAQGLDYYLRFMERFPTLLHLADADQDSVLKSWQGLGYYSRARNLHKAARQIRDRFEAVFPTQHQDIISLAGVGDYTAAAIASFAFNLPYAVVDGNVYRLLSRLFGIDTPIDSSLGKKEFALLAQNLLSDLQPGLHNQAMMEFGALQCVPVAPNCTVCPFQDSCVAFLTNQVPTLPLKSKKTKVRHRFFNYLFIEYQGQTFLQRRIQKDVWHNLYEFPLVESDRLLESTELFENEFFNHLFKGVGDLTVSYNHKPMKHILTHQHIFAQFISIKIKNLNAPLSQYDLVTFDKINNYAVSRLMELFIQKSH